MLPILSSTEYTLPEELISPVWGLERIDYRNIHFEDFLYVN